MSESLRSRREFLKTTAVGTAAMALPAMTSACAAAEPHVTTSGIKLGVASYSLRELTRADTISAINAIRAQYVSVKSMHLPYESSADEIAIGVGRSRMQESRLWAEALSHYRKTTTTPCARSSNMPGHVECRSW